MHLDNILRDLDFADNIVLLDENSESATGHVICLKEIASAMGLNINFKKTKTYFIICDTDTYCWTTTNRTCDWLPIFGFHDSLTGWRP